MVNQNMVRAHEGKCVFFWRKNSDLCLLFFEANALNGSNNRIAPYVRTYS